MTKKVNMSKSNVKISFRVCSHLLVWTKKKENIKHLVLVRFYDIILQRTLSNIQNIAVCWAKCAYCICIHMIKVTAREDLIKCVSHRVCFKSNQTCQV